MPCTYGNEKSNEELLQEDVDKMARIACKVFKKLEDRRCLHWASAEGRAWWKRHKKKDEERKNAVQ